MLGLLIETVPVLTLRVSLHYLISLRHLLFLLAYA